MADIKTTNFGFSKLSKEDKLRFVAKLTKNPEEFTAELKSFWHADEGLQKRFDEFSENTLTNFFMPFGVVPNVKINDKFYTIPSGSRHAIAPAICPPSEVPTRRIRVADCCLMKFRMRSAKPPTL